MYRETIRIRSDDTIRLNTNTLFGPLFGTEANTKRLFGTSLVFCHCNLQVLDHLCFLGKLKDKGYSSNDAAVALLLFDNSLERVMHVNFDVLCCRKNTGCIILAG